VNIANGQSEERRRSLAQEWKKLLVRSLDSKTGIAAVVRSNPALGDWSLLRSAPSGRAEDELRFAVQIAAADYDHALVNFCLRRCLEVVEAAKKDQRWETWWSSSRNVEYGRLLTAGEFARSWLADADLDSGNLMSVAELLRAGSIDDRPVWSEMAQSEYLHAVQVVILAGQPTQAAKMLGVRKSFRAVQRYFDWHVTLLHLLTAGSIDTSKLLAHFDPYFDELRDPFFESPINDPTGNNVVGVAHVRLRLALIRWIYIERQPVAGNWRHIIGQIGY
jgi:hypothetical protein